MASAEDGGIGPADEAEATSSTNGGFRVAKRRAEWLASNGESTVTPSTVAVGLRAEIAAFEPPLTREERAEDRFDPRKDPPERLRRTEVERSRVQRHAAATITPRRVTFLDRRKTLPRSSLVVIAGRTGLGKTLYAIQLAADASCGRLETAGPIDVLYSTGEDDRASVLVPRLMAAGADLERVHFLGRHVGEGIEQAIVLPDDVDELAEHARAVSAGLLFIDPIGAHLSGDVDSHRDADVRRALAPLQSLASECTLTVPVVAHLKKGREADPLSRVSGSGAFGNAPRSVLILGTDPDDEAGDRGDRRVIAHAKSNVAPRAESLAAHIEQTDVEIEGGPFGVPVLTLDGDSPHSAADVLDVPDAGERSDLEAAKDWLLERLQQPVRTPELKAAATHNGISPRTLERAKSKLEIKAAQGGDGWYWLPPGQLELGGDE